MLLRIPVKSLRACKRVSKSWLKIISDPTSSVQKKLRILAAKRLQITFTKRRKALFNKAAELSVLCGAQVALVAFSPGGIAFAYRHPKPYHILNRILNNGEAVTDSTQDDEMSLLQQQ
ncbi:hypothetical protein MKW94_011003 [Papaver nudicaule]|uniref:MADS-box domain-containing protein n=1 Tax=Papaver nudicaule TaxID=74823 RepID=A0AA41RYY6_PAPNU|nr:hypothetical protein [Papaver nudicaule]